MCFTVWSIVMLQVIYVLSATHSAKSTDSMYVLSFVIKAAESIHFFALRPHSSLLPSNTTYWANVGSRVTFCAAVITPIVFHMPQCWSYVHDMRVFYVPAAGNLFADIPIPDTAAGLNEPLITGIYFFFFSRVNAWIMTFHKVKELSRDFSNKL